MLRARVRDRILLLCLKRSRRNPGRRSLHQNFVMRRQTGNLTRPFRQIWIDKYSKLPSLQLRNQLTGSNFIIHEEKWRRKEDKNQMIFPSH
jgi:hypothetical protein